MGELWEKETQQPIPLGGIVVKRDISPENQRKINSILRTSVDYAFANPDSSYEYVKANAQEMDEDVRRKHIALYVNDFSIDLGVKGKEAINIFFQNTDSIRPDIFLNAESPTPISQLL